MLPYIQAYSGVSQTLRNYESSLNSNHSFIAVPPNGTDTTTINVSENGTIQGFFAEVDLSSGSFSDPNMTLIFKLKRNGQEIFKQSLNVYEWVTLTGYSKGILLYETLNFLSGAEVVAGETLTLDVDWSIPGGSGNIQYTQKINLVIRAISRQFNSVFF